MEIHVQATVGDATEAARFLDTISQALRQGDTSGEHWLLVGRR